jgi:hypothetical protein
MSIARNLTRLLILPVSVIALVGQRVPAKPRRMRERKTHYPQHHDLIEDARMAREMDRL